VALTGKEAETDYLKGLGAKEVKLRQSLDLAKIRPLDKALWAGAVDNLGAMSLPGWRAPWPRAAPSPASPCSEHRAQHHCSAIHPARACLLGIDSGYTPCPCVSRCGRAWHRHEAQAPRRHDAHHRLRTVAGVFDAFIKGKAKGRIVVDLAA